MGVPLVFAFYGRKRSAFRFWVLAAMLLLSAVCVIKTKSRSGQLTFAATLGVYFVRRYKWKGAIVAIIAAAPVMLLGGRGGEEASASTEERLEAWRAGFTMLKSDYLLGVGHAQFTDHHYLTAHSSLVLTLAELGPIGFFLWTAIVYFAFKITIRAQIEYAGSERAAVAQTWSMALLASLTGTLVSAFFLSIPYHPILWGDIGLVGALYAAIRNHDPNFQVRFGWADFGAVVVGDIAIVTSLKLYLMLHSS
jgi:O-antigen ligase